MLVPAGVGQSTIVLDGVFSDTEGGVVRVHEASELQPHHWQELQRIVRRRVVRYFRRHELLDEPTTATATTGVLAPNARLPGPHLWRAATAVPAGIARSVVAMIFFRVSVFGFRSAARPHWVFYSRCSWLTSERILAAFSPVLPSSSGGREDEGGRSNEPGGGRSEVTPWI